MGQTTPNIGIYIPAAGETNYDASFAAGMVNLDQHDHSGGPNKGVLITGTGLADFSVTYNKLNANVADNTTGIGTSAILLNQLQILGLLQNIYKLATTAGFISKDGSNAHARTITGTAPVVVTNGDGVAGNPTISLPNTFFDTGTFTPTVNTSNNDMTGTAYILQDGNWQKIGKWIMIDLEVVFNNASGTGNIIIQGLPFPSIGTYWFAGYSNSASQAPNQQVSSYQTSGSDIAIFPVGVTQQLPAPGGSFGWNFQLTGIYQWTA